MYFFHLELKQVPKILEQFSLLVRIHVHDKYNHLHRAFSRTNGSVRWTNDYFQWWLRSCTKQNNAVKGILGKLGKRYHERLWIKTNRVGKSAICETDNDTRGDGKQESWPNQVTKKVCDWWSNDFVKRQPRSGRPGTKGPRRPLWSADKEGERSVNGDTAGSLALDPAVRIQMMSRLFEEMEENCSEGRELWKRFLEKTKERSGLVRGAPWKTCLFIRSAKNFFSLLDAYSVFCMGSSLQTSHVSIFSHILWLCSPTYSWGRGWRTMCRDFVIGAYPSASGGY